MKNIKYKPYFYFWLTAILMLVKSYISNLKYGDAVLDINVHDTYYVISQLNIAIILSLFYFILGLIYWVIIFKKIPLINSLTKFHTIITVCIIPLYYIGSKIVNMSNQSNFPLFDDSYRINNYITVLAILFIIAQILFILNIFQGLIKYFSNK